MLHEGITNQIKDAHSVGKSVCVRFVDGRVVTFSLRGQARQRDDIVRVARAINDGVRAQAAEKATS